MACINAVFYWFSNPVWIGGSLVLLTLEAVNTYFFDIGTGGFLWYVVGLAYIWFSVWSAILSFGIGKWIPTLGAWCRMVLLGGFTIAALIYAISNGLSLPAAGDFSPTYGLFIVLVPLLFFNYVGFELPNAAGDEMEDPQSDVPITVLRACVTAILMYGLPILAIVVRAAQVADHRRRRLHGLGQGRLHRLRWPQRGGERRHAQRHADRVRQGARLRRRVRLRARARLERVHLADGLRPLAGGRGLRRLRPALAGHVLGQVRHADQRRTSPRACSRRSCSSSPRSSAAMRAKIFAAMIGVVLLFTTMSYILIFPTVIKLRKSHRRHVDGRSRSRSG